MSYCPYFFLVSRPMTNKTTTPLFYLGSLAAFSLLTFDLFQPALPAITKSFQTTQAVGQLTLSLFLFIYGLSQLFWGPIIDHYGRKKPLYYSLVLFFIATSVCILAPNIWVLIIGRVLQAFAVCCANNLAFSSTRDIDDSTQRAKTISYIVMILSVSPIFAPVIGSYIFLWSNWQMIFWTMQGIAFFLGIFGMKYLQESRYWRQPNKKIRLKRSLLRYAFLMQKTGIIKAALMTSASFSCVMIFVVNASYLIINGMGYSPTQFGYIFAFIGINLIVSNYIGIILRAHKSLHWNIRFGTAMMLSGSLIMLLSFILLGVQLLSIAPLLLVYLGVSLTNPPTFSIALNEYKEISSSVTALINTVRSTFSALIAAGFSLLIYLNPKFFPLGMTFCSVICLCLSVLTYKLTSSENNA